MGKAWKLRECMLYHHQEKGGAGEETGRRSEYKRAWRGRLSIEEPFKHEY